jgi:hypothetical protein
MAQGWAGPHVPLVENGPVHRRLWLRNRTLWLKGPPSRCRLNTRMSPEFPRIQDRMWHSPLVCAGEARHRCEDQRRLGGFPHSLSGRHGHVLPLIHNVSRCRVGLSPNPRQMIRDRPRMTADSLRMPRDPSRMSRDPSTMSCDSSRMSCDSLRMSRDPSRMSRHRVRMPRPPCENAASPFENAA